MTHNLPDAVRARPMINVPHPRDQIQVVRMVARNICYNTVDVFNSRGIFPRVEIDIPINEQY
jgi:hypothetical protein